MSSFLPDYAQWLVHGLAAPRAVATFVTQASIPEGCAVGIAMALAGVYGIWRLEKVPLA